ncbi:trypsin-like serine protease [Micromonospora thermarum]|uniref:S1 family peptidase n=1 Tax=Micromonospora thermarum TaxID=2720024 RepID=A0ABX0Z5Y3_9ACTN|nr:trypsin-like serine protease [Micromonospora thermarum]NJP33265.1 S1 family peptidase [Micromonospora thermarum]
MRTRTRIAVAGLAAACTIGAAAVALAPRDEAGRAPAAPVGAAEDPGVDDGSGPSTGTDEATGDTPPSPEESRAAAGDGSAARAPVAPASVAYLRDRYRVSATEATRRLALQNRSASLAERLADRFPDTYGGMWLDQAGGGLLTIAATDTAPVRAALSDDPDRTRIRLVPVRVPLARLTAAASRLATALDGAAGTDVVVNQPANEVIVLTGDRIAADDPRLGDALADAGVAARAQARGAGTSVSKACDPRYCAQAPMRGGIRLDVPRDDGTVGGCTTGFNIVGRGAVSYVLTAGHCVVGGRHQHVDLTWHQYLGPKVRVGIESTTPVLAENAFPYDYAIMPYVSNAIERWAYPRTPGDQPSLVNYWCVPDNPRCTSSRDVRITGLVPASAVQVGWVVCATGSGYTPKPGEQYVDSGAGAGYLPGTRCGEVTDKTSGGIGVRICARPGDSGGPLFTESDGKAIGILSHGDPGSGPCTNPNERNVYAPVSTILDRANARTGGSLSLTLATRGPMLVRPAQR